MLWHNKKNIPRGENVRPTGKHRGLYDTLVKQPAFENFTVFSSKINGGPPLISGPIIASNT